MKKIITAVVSAALVAMPLTFTVAQAASSAKKPVPRTQAARATANHNAKVDADKAQRASRQAAEKSRKDAAKAKRDVKK